MQVGNLIAKILLIQSIELTLTMAKYSFGIRRVLLSEYLYCRVLTVIHAEDQFGRTCRIAK